MPDIAETRLSPDEIRTRRAAMRDAVASARIEGAEVSPAAQSIMEMHNRGEITDEEMIIRIRELHAAK
jgi:hypothetical protein